jgi:hypothetical protein
VAAGGRMGADAGRPNQEIGRINVVFASNTDQGE